MSFVDGKKVVVLVFLLVLTLSWVGDSAAKCDCSWDCLYDEDVAGRNIKDFVVPWEYGWPDHHCKKECLNEPGCTFIVFLNNERRCYLKESYGNGPAGKTGPKPGALTCKKA